MDLKFFNLGLLEIIPGLIQRLSPGMDTMSIVQKNGLGKNEKQANTACAGQVGVCSIYKHFPSFEFILLSSSFLASRR
jgi:hypothetical protein